MTTATLIHKALSAEMSVTEGERAFIAKITSNAVDRDREVLMPEGLIKTEFEQNPVLFYGHDYIRDPKSLPIGQVVSLKRFPDYWLAKSVMAERPDNHVGEWFPDTVFSLIQQGVIRGVSVGFEPVDSRAPTKKDKEMFGEDVQKVYRRWKLLELSVAPLMANQEALIQAVSKGLIGRTQAKAMFGVDVPEPVKRKCVVLMYAKAVTVKPKPDIVALVRDGVRREFDRRRGKIYS